MVGNLSEETSRWEEFEQGDQQVVGSLSEGTSIWWGI